MATDEAVLALDPLPCNTDAEQSAQIGGDVNASGSTAEQTESAENSGLAQRYLADQWIARYDDGPFLKFVHGSWTEVGEDETELIQQLWYEQEAAETQVFNGVKMKWNASAKQWMPIEEVDEDFLAAYQANYGLDYDYSQMEVKKPESQHSGEELNKTNEGPKTKDRHKPPPQGWIEMDDKANAVYVSNLPPDIAEDEFHDFMAKCGVIQVDPRNNKPKVKLYRNAQGELKGDGTCTYIKPESVELALNILDGAQFKSSTVTVEKAHFELKGEYDPSKRKRKLTAQQKKRFVEQQNKIFAWIPEKPRNYRPKSDCVVIVKGLFTIEEMQANAALVLDLKEEMTKNCSKYGTVKKVVVYDNNPEGVVSVHFTNTEESDLAVKMMDNRIVDGKLLHASHWDGKAKFKVEETEEERERRMAEWDRFIESGGEPGEPDSIESAASDKGDDESDEDEDSVEEDQGASEGKRPHLEE